MENEEIKNLLIKQRQETKEDIQGLKIYVDEKFDVLDKKIDFKAEEAQEKTERYLGALKEDFDHKLAVVMEVAKDVVDIKETIKDIPAIKEAIQDIPLIKEIIKDIPAIKEKLDLTFDKVGEIAVDVEVIKEVIKDHEQELQQLRAR